jgi:hypothetical protein
MAGAGYKLFATGDVLTAAQVNTYLNEQTVMVFANSAARTSALSGVLAEGMMSYLQDTNAVEVYNGSAWTAVGGGGLSSPLTTKGDVWGYSTTNARIPVGSNGTVLTADSAETLGVKWAAPASASGPTFRAYLGSVQNPSANTLTKVVFDTESWDTDACYDPTTNYRFTPNKAGYYMVNLALTMTADPLNKPNISIIYKNGAQYENLYIGAPMVTTSECLASAATIINFNGTTDYIEAYYYSEAGTSRSIVQGSINTHFSAVWIRS